MFLVPYFKDCSTPNWIQLGVFLSEGGRSVWYTEATTESDIRSLLEDNGFPTLHLTTHNDTIYAEIDLTRMNLNDFYLWSEVDLKTSDRDVWRTLQIPVALWSCPVFKEHFWAQAKMPRDVGLRLNAVLYIE